MITKCGFHRLHDLRLLSFGWDKSEDELILGVAHYILIYKYRRRSCWVDTHILYCIQHLCCSRLFSSIGYPNNGSDVLSCICLQPQVEYGEVGVQEGGAVHLHLRCIPCLLTSLHYFGPFSFFIYRPWLWWWWWWSRSPICSNYRNTNRTLYLHYSSHTQSLDHWYLLKEMENSS